MIGRPARAAAATLLDLNNNLQPFYGHTIYQDIIWRGPAWTFYFDDEDLTLAPYEESLKAMRSSDTAFYAVVLPSRFLALDYWEDKQDRREDRLRKFAEATRGRLFVLKRINEFPSVLSRILQEQRSGIADTQKR